jgi:cytochrome c
VTWTAEVLDAYLTDPKAYMPGNKMTFVGLPKPEDRANLIAWLQANGA